MILNNKSLITQKELVALVLKGLDPILLEIVLTSMDIAFIDGHTQGRESVKGNKEVLPF